MIRRASHADLDAVLGWAAAEGWNPGLDDAAAFHAADPEGFFLAEDEGRPVAAISVVNHSDRFAFLGLYLCLPEFRGRGMGFSLWQHALGHAGDRTVGLDGVAAQEANYARSGFLRTGATCRFEGPAPAPGPGGTRPATPADREALARLDRGASGIDRPQFLTAWTAPAPTRRSLVLEREGRIQGLATARLCREGCKVGPVIAPDPETARALIGAAAASLGAARVIVDLPDRQTALIAALRAAGFAPTFETARMYKGMPPATDGTLFAIATMELG